MQVSKSAWGAYDSFLQPKKKEKLNGRKEDDQETTGKKSIIQKCVSKAPDGSSVITLIKVTISDDGSTSPPKIIGTYKLGKCADEEGVKTIHKDETAEKNDAKANEKSAESLYEQNSLASRVGSGALFSEQA